MESEKAENTILHVLKQLHIEQKTQLEERFRTEIQAARDEARANVGERRQQEKDDLIAQQEKVKFMVPFVVLHTRPGVYTFISERASIYV